MILYKLAKLILCSMVTVLLLCGVAIKSVAAKSAKPSLVMVDTQQEEVRQLEKARAAAAKTEGREREILEKQSQNDWETQQMKKSQEQFSQRETREERYLREAKEAAAKTRKITLD